MSKKYTKKLGTDNYKRPKATFQEQLSAEDIAEKLQGYVRISSKELCEVPIESHLRYFTIDENGKQQFRLGGFLKNKINCEKYVILSNGKSSWTVQTGNAVFFRKLSHDEEIEQIHEIYRKKIKEKDEIIRKLKKYVKAKLAQEETFKSKSKRNK